MRIKSIIFVLFCFVLIGCNETKNNIEENDNLIKKLNSNNNSTFVKLYEVAYGGATGGFKYVLSFSNKEINSKVLLAEKVRDIDIYWQNANTLIVSIDSDRIHFFTNFWYDRPSNMMYKIKLKDNQLNEK